MAEIPVEKRSSGIPWWVWVLALLAIIALVWWLIAANDDDAAADADADAVEYSADPSNDIMVMDDTELTDVLAIGSSIDVDNVRVTELAGDMSFWADIDERRTFVIFDQEQTPADMTEGEFDINPGSMLSITGDVFASDEAIPSAIDAQVPANVDRYVVARTIEMATPSN
ncbi:hypothetical protein WJS89_04765 [Sphingomicrobium sp. XHP0235]|uniref:hypothetical protein n=1 Tax=Sphingomicrobium aquimarinum TaxID=3133971 RepID=UPI0031FECDC9